VADADAGRVSDAASAFDKLVGRHQASRAPRARRTARRQR
jgi:hypothetical protein